MSREAEICSKCGRAIGPKEQACVLDNEIVCEQCDAKLRRHRFDASLCFFCGRRPADDDSSLAVTMFKDGDVRGELAILWENGSAAARSSLPIHKGSHVTGSVDIPRCSVCKGQHKRVHMVGLTALFVTWIVSVALAVIVGLSAASSMKMMRDGAILTVGFWSLFGVALGYPFGKVAAAVVGWILRPLLLAGVKPITHRRKHSVVKLLLNARWKIGAKPKGNKNSFPIELGPNAMRTIQQQGERRPDCPGFDWKCILKEAADLPFREDKLYQKAELQKMGLAIIVGLLLVPGGVLLAIVDIYTSAAIPFGWLLGLCGAAVGALCLVFGTLMFVIVGLNRDYKVTPSDLPDFVRIPFDSMGGAADVMKQQAQKLPDSSWQLMLPNSRNLLADFMLVVGEIMGRQLDSYCHQAKQRKADVRLCSGGTSVLYKVPWCKNDAVQYLGATIDVKGPRQGASSGQRRYAEITLVAVKSDAGKWYLALPKADQADWCVKFLW